jgi:hypothetical protein
MAVGTLAAPASCRDKGKGRVDAGALCLSWLECDHQASRNPGESRCHEDKHKAPTHPHIRPLSLQDAGDEGGHFQSLFYSVVKNHQFRESFALALIRIDML